VFRIVWCVQFVLTFRRHVLPLPTVKKSKFVSVYTLKANTGSRGIAPLLTSVLYEGEWSTSRPGLLGSEKKFRYSLNRRLCGPQRVYGPQRGMGILK
jgi:hypothetical protein